MTNQWEIPDEIRRRVHWKAVGDGVVAAFATIFVQMVIPFAYLLIAAGAEYFGRWVLLAPLLLSIAAGVLAYSGSRISQIERYRKQHNLCVRCGYDLRASRDRCPECGALLRAAAIPPARDGHTGGSASSARPS